MYDSSDTACATVKTSQEVITQPALIEPMIKKILLSAPQYRKGQQ